MDLPREEQKRIANLRAQIANYRTFSAQYEREVASAKTDRERNAAKSRLEGARNQIKGWQDELRHTYGISA